MDWKKLVSSPWFGVIGLVSLILGIPGMQEDAAEWRTWFSAMSAGWQGALVGAGTVMVFLFVAANIARLLPFIRARTLPFSSGGASFDTPIRQAIEHLIQTIPHSFNNLTGAERMAFDALYEEMCDGRLSVVGSCGEGRAPQRISARRCNRLKPTATVIPRNPTSPQGKRFDLVDGTTLKRAADRTWRSCWIYGAARSQSRSLSDLAEGY